MISRLDALHDAWDRLAAHAYLDQPGLAAHGPMAAEALSSLGYDDGVAAWVETYKRRHPALAPPPSVERIDPTDEHSWRAALGDVGRLSDWEAAFREELWDQPWPTVLARWVPRLLPGYGGGLTHGLLRVAHAARALPPDEPPSLLAVGELAKGLAFWAGFFHPLPGCPHLRGPRPLPEAIAGLPHPDEPWTPIEMVSFARLDELHGFPEAVQALAGPDDVDDALSDLTGWACRWLVANPDLLSHWMVHLVTPVAAIRTLLPLVPTLTVDAVYAQLWQVDAALIAGSTVATPTPPIGIADTDIPAPTDLAAQAVEHQDFHVLKFTEAALREHALRPDPAYLLAARRLVETSTPW